MHLSTLLDMAASGCGDRVAFGSRTGGLTYAGLAERAQRAARWIAGRGVERVALVDVNTEAVPLLLYGSAYAGVPFAPLNYRLADEQLGAVLARTAPSVAVVDDDALARFGPIDGVQVVARSAFLDAVEAGADGAQPSPGLDTDEAAILLFTSGTTGAPKAAVLRHRHLASYVIGTVEFMGAADDEAMLVSAPAYHIAGISSAVTSVYAGRRIVYLPRFEPEEWVATVRHEAVTQAMIVPTMLARILDVLERDEKGLPSLRHLSYGGGRMPVPVIERALAMLPDVRFVNAYGLTETSSTISVLGPEDHRLAVAGDDPAARRRLASVGRPLPTVEVSIRDDDGRPVGPGDAGEVWVRGEQVAGEYLGHGHTGDDGWFPTRDSGSFDEDGYLYLHGRLDDVIVRGGENTSPGEIEDVLVAHPAVADVGVVGVPDVEWGEMIVAVVVLHRGASATEGELQAWARARLRSSKTPQHVVFRDELPYNELGKLLRRVLRTELTGPLADASK